VTDWAAMPLPLPPITSVRPAPLDRASLEERLRLTGVSAALALLGIPVALALAILSILSVPLGLAFAGFVIAIAVVPATEQLTALHRKVSGALLADEITAGYADTSGVTPLLKPVHWLRDPARWRDVAFLWFSATGGFVLSVLPVGMLTAPVVHMTGAVLDGGFWWWLLVLLDGPLLAAWWLTTPALVRARAFAERGILGHGRVERLEQEVSDVRASRAETLDHSAAEVRRIERDLHDGAQARMTAVGMNVGLAEKLMETDPTSAAELLREARETTLSALADLRAVIRGIHPPALADLGLAGGIEALAAAIPVPVTLSVNLDGEPPAPVESAVYFAAAECLTNVVKHADAARAWVTLSHEDGWLRVLVGDDGRGGADPTSSGLAGVARRLAAFDGTMTVSSPAGGPTVVTMEVPCVLSSPRTRPSSGSA
jgi:signal transduction histidine kinase